LADWGGWLRGGAVLELWEVLSMVLHLEPVRVSSEYDQLAAAIVVVLHVKLLGQCIAFGLLELRVLLRRDTRISVAN
jgi:hypothetical protein